MTFRIIPRERSSAEIVSLEFAAIVCALLLANRIATIHHFTWVWLAIAAYAAAALRKNARPPEIDMLAFAVGVGLLFLTWRFFAWFNGQTGPLRLLACNTFAGALLIWICLLRQLRRVRKVEAQTDPSQDLRLAAQ
jgi:hypothetical protein